MRVYADRITPACVACRVGPKATAPSSGAFTNVVTPVLPCQGDPPLLLTHLPWCYDHDRKETPMSLLLTTLRWIARLGALVNAGAFVLLVFGEFLQPYSPSGI